MIEGAERDMVGATTLTTDLRHLYEAEYQHHYRRRLLAMQFRSLVDVIANAAAITALLLGTAAAIWLAAKAL